MDTVNSLNASFNQPVRNINPRQNELPRSEASELAGQQAVEASTAREAQRQQATQQVNAVNETAVTARFNTRTSELATALQSQLINRQSETQQQNSRDAVRQNVQQNAANQANLADAPERTPQASNSTTQQAQSDSRRLAANQANNTQDSSRRELNASAQQQAVVQYQTTQSLLQSRGSDSLNTRA